MLFLSYFKQDTTPCNFGGRVYYEGDVIEGVDEGNSCVCNSNGNIVCNEGNSADVVNVSEFSSDGVDFSYDFVSLISQTSSFVDDVKFVNISQTGSSLKVVFERKSFCSDDGLAAPQIGLFKEDGNNLVLKVSTNLVNEEFNNECVVEDTFEIENLRSVYPNGYGVVYQDEFNNLMDSNNCVYEGRLRNDGDVYQSEDRCLLCTCDQGLNDCEQEDSCLE